jgi:hypothetical protein
MLDGVKTFSQEVRNASAVSFRKGGAPNGLGRAYRPWSACVCRQAAVCSQCHHLAPGYDQLGERRFDSSAVGFFVFMLYAHKSLES